jgi:hypothetical protein
VKGRAATGKKKLGTLHRCHGTSSRHLPELLRAYHRLLGETTWVCACAHAVAWRLGKLAVCQPPLELVFSSLIVNSCMAEVEPGCCLAYRVGRHRISGSWMGRLRRDVCWRGNDWWSSLSPGCASVRPSAPVSLPGEDDAGAPLDAKSRIRIRTRVTYRYE